AALAEVIRVLSCVIVFMNPNIDFRLRYLSRNCRFMLRSNSSMFERYPGLEGSSSRLVVSGPSTRFHWAQHIRLSSETPLLSSRLLVRKDSMMSSTLLSEKVVSPSLYLDVRSRFWSHALRI